MLGSNAAHVVILRKNRKETLLVLRRDFRIWVIPGGHLQLGETFRQAGIREVYEETGYKVELKGPVVIYYDSARKIQKQVFLGRIKGGRKKLSNESAEVEWFYLENLPRPITLYEIQRITDAASFNGRRKRKILKFQILPELKWQLQKPFDFLPMTYRWLTHKWQHRKIR